MKGLVYYMAKFFKNIIKSVLLGILVIFLFLFPLAWSQNGELLQVIIIGVAIISTIIFCTFYLIDIINNKK